jgi:hypothetical protein
MRRFPQNKAFAFSIFDDTDHCSLSNVEPVYELLFELGFRTTKSVWPLHCVQGGRISGATLQEKPYLHFIRRLQTRGFEVGFHNARNHDSPRGIIERGFEEFNNLLGLFPRVHCNHSRNRENIYWGPDRLGSVGNRITYGLATRFSRQDFFQGHVEGSPFFWGDLCKMRISYVRNFVFDEINLDRVNPSMPYHDPAKPYVNYWFSSCEGDDVNRFCRMITEANQDRLLAQGGVCIMYTHFAKGFCSNGILNPQFERLMRRLARLNGWFVPVSTLLDHLRRDKRDCTITKAELNNMERRWLFSKLRKGTT